MGQSLHVKAYEFLRAEGFAVHSCHSRAAQLGRSGASALAVAWRLPRIR
jgi:hypothetical protein